jgi:hypothetical protein
VPFLDLKYLKIRVAKQKHAQSRQRGNKYRSGNGAQGTIESLVKANKNNSMDFGVQALDQNQSYLFEPGNHGLSEVQVHMQTVTTHGSLLNKKGSLAPQLNRQLDPYGNETLNAKSGEFSKFASRQSLAVGAAS